MPDSLSMLMHTSLPAVLVTAVHGALARVASPFGNFADSFDHFVEAFEPDLDAWDALPLAQAVVQRAG